VLAESKRVRLYSSEYCVAEIREVASRTQLREKFRITDDRLERFIERLRLTAEFVADVPERYVHPTDPDDSHYVNLAAATNAHLVVSRDGDLLRLPTANDAIGREFRRLFPSMLVMRPEEFLAAMDSRQ
jgi:putative PIN family toxin of toxin-antitoxin system